jgi:hypothetical protein
VDGTEQEEGLVVVVKERKETGKRGVLREDELGRVVIPLAELELMDARDNWYVSFAHACTQCRLTRSLTLSADAKRPGTSWLPKSRGW